MLQQHPITPPPELVEQLRNDAPHGIRDAGVTRERQLAVAAYRAGADAELEACMDQLRRWGFQGVENLRNTRRPKPPSLAEQALTKIGAVLSGNPRMSTLTDILEALELSRRALKRLQELENNG